MVSIVNIQEIKDTLQDFLRSSDIISTAIRSVTTVTELFDGDGTETEFTLTNVPHNIREVVVDSVTLYNYKDFTTDYATKIIAFNVAPSDDTDNVSIKYDYGTTTGDKIYSDYPRDDLNISSYPRVGIDVLTVTPSDIDLSHSITQNNVIVSIIARASSRVATETIISNIRQAIVDNRKSVGSIRYITFSNLSPILVYGLGDEQIFQRTIDISLPAEFDGTC